MGKLKELIEEYNQIAIYRHVNPDLDAFGSQYGFYWMLKTNYPNKNIVAIGKKDNTLFHLFQKDNDEVLSNEKTLGIVLDTANRERIDGDYSICDKIVKIDHHIVVDSYGDYNIEEVTASSCSEIVTLLFKDNQFEVSLDSANALYLGIVGDSNRFLYNSTSTKTFVAASFLLEQGIKIENLYQSLYLKKKADIEITKFIYNNYQESNGIAYYYLSKEDLEHLNMTREQGSSYVNTLANIEEFLIWMAITENDVDHNYRVSIRSRQIAINEVASEFKGGGHAFASGATLDSLDDLERLLGKLKEKMNG